MKTFVGYASMSGNTEEVALILKEVLLSKGCSVHIQSLEDVAVESLVDYDCLLIGSYTWGDGDLPYEVEDFFDELDSIEFHGINAACFGTGDSIYPKFCEAVHTLSNKLQERGCSVFHDFLKIEQSPEDDEQIEECQQFAKVFYNWASRKTGTLHV